MIRFFRLSAIVLCCMVWGQLGFGEKLPPSATLLPEQTVILIDIDNIDTLNKNFQKSRLYQFYKDPSMQKFIEKARDGILKNLTEESFKFSRLLFDNKVYPSGRLSIAFLFKPGQDSGEDLGYLVISQWGDNINKLCDALNKDISRTLEQGGHRTVTPFRGIEIISVITRQKPEQSQAGDEESSEDNPQENISPKETRISHCIINDAVYLSDDEEILKGLIARLKGSESPSLAQTSEYKTAMKNVDQRGDIQGFINFEQIFSNWMKNEAPEMKKILSSAGFDGFYSLAFSISICPQPGNDFSSRAFLRTSNPKKGIFKLLEMDSSPYTIPSFFNASAEGFSYINLDVSKVTRELFSILSGFSPMAAAAMTAPIIPPDENNQSAITIKDDILGQLNGPIYTCETFQSVSGQTTVQNDTLVCMGVKDRDRFSNSLARIHQRFILPRYPDSRREFMGQTLYVIPMSSVSDSDAESEESDDTPKSPQATSFSSNVAIAITSTHLLIGTQNAVEQALRAAEDQQREKLESQRWLREAKTKIPSLVGMVNFQNTATAMKYIWSEVKDPEFQNNLFGYFIDEEKDDPMKRIFDFALLPEFTAVEKYFGVSVSYLKTETEGFSFTAEHFYILKEE